jgi:hypothetical protein
MKEVLTKTFWRGVKKTFQDGLNGPAAEDHTPQAPADGNPKISSTSERGIEAQEPSGKGLPISQ